MDGNPRLVKSFSLLMEGNLSFLVNRAGGTMVDPFGRALVAQILGQDVLRKVHRNIELANNKGYTGYLSDRKSVV